MLNIPESVKALFKTDGVHKDFRVHFPNGEMADITNENVVQESMHFTESICSQDVFRFGLAEASVLEFETVGMGNMYGMTIEAAIEIDVSSLTPAEIATIGAGTWDGTLSGAVFSVPLGVFRVDSCPRNHGAMTHRQVTAYTIGGSSKEIMSPFEEWKQSTYWAKQIGSKLSYTSLDALLDANTGRLDPTIISQKYTKSALALSAFSSSGESSNIVLSGGTLHISYTPTSSLYWSASVAQPYLFAADINDFDNTAAKAFIENALADWGLERCLDKVLTRLHNAMYICFYPSGSYPRLVSSVDNPPYLIERDEPILYVPDNATYTGSTFPALVTVPVSGSITLTWTPTGGSADTKTNSFVFSNGSPVGLYKLSPNQAITLGISFDSTGAIAYNNVKYFSFANTYSAIELLKGSAELKGMFQTESRTGETKVFALDPSSPVAIVPGDYESVWWDEYDISPIGTVTVTYGGENGEATADIRVGYGASLYDMTENEMLKALNISSLEEVASFLSSDFATNAANVGFTPIEMTMQGWPWIEAGDALEITAEDGTVVDTYALRVEISGIQNLTAVITAQGGEIIGEV